MKADKKEERRSAAALVGLSIIAMRFMDHIWIRLTLENYQRIKTLVYDCFLVYANKMWWNMFLNFKKYESDFILKTFVIR